MAEPIRAEATVIAARAASSAGGPDDGDSYWWQDLGSAVFGKTAWDVALEVRPPGGQPYQLQIRTKQPNKLFGIRGFLDGTTAIAPGLVLPVLIDAANPNDVRIDWKAFEATAGARERMQGAEDDRRSAQATSIYAQKLRDDPKRFQKNRTVVLDGARSLADGVRNGTSKLDDLRKVLDTNVPIGLITTDEADAIWRSATPDPGPARG